MSKRIEIKFDRLGMVDIREVVRIGKDLIKGTNNIAFCSDFNGTEINITENTDIQLVLRDFNNSFYSENKSIGPIYLKKLPPSSLEVINTNKIISDIEFSLSQAQIHLDEISDLVNKYKKTHKF